MKNLNTPEEVKTAYATTMDKFFAAYAAEDFESARALTSDIYDLYELAQDMTSDVEEAKEYAERAWDCWYNYTLAQAVTELTQEFDEWVATIEWIEDYRADEYRAVVDEL